MKVASHSVSISPPYRREVSLPLIAVAILTLVIRYPVRSWECTISTHHALGRTLWNKSPITFRLPAGALHNQHFTDVARNVRLVLLDCIHTRSRWTNLHYVHTGHQLPRVIMGWARKTSMYFECKSSLIGVPRNQFCSHRVP